MLTLDYFLKCIFVGICPAMEDKIDWSRKPKNPITFGMVGTALVAGYITTIGFLLLVDMWYRYISGDMGDSYISECFEDTKKIKYQKVLKYTDTNHDGKITRTERDNFCEYLYGEKGITIKGDIPQYENGSEVSIDSLLESAKNYNLHPNRQNE